MPWVAAAPAIISAVGGIAGGLLGHSAKKREAKQQREFMRWLYDPNRINRSAQMMNPFLAYAMGMPQAGQGTPAQRMQFQQLMKQMQGNPFAEDLRKIATGQDISKYLLNQPLHEIDRGQTNTMQRLQQTLGRSGMSGGMAQLAALSQLGARNVNRAKTMRDYGLWREGQRRNDINNLMGMWGNVQNQVIGQQPGQQQGYTPIPSAAGAWGGAMPFLAQQGADIFKAFQSPNSSGSSSIQTGAGNPFGTGVTFGLNPNQFNFGGK